MRSSLLAKKINSCIYWQLGFEVHQDGYQEAINDVVWGEKMLGKTPSLVSGEG